MHTYIYSYKQTFFSLFSTTDWVAMPAWSVPGTHRVTFPFIRCQRVIVSSMAVVRAWPKCKDPVTFGGGITMTNLSSALLLSANSTFGW